MHVNSSDSEIARSKASMTCTVLVVDDDPACRDEYCDAIEIWVTPPKPQPTRPTHYIKSRRRQTSAL